MWILGFSEVGVEFAVSVGGTDSGGFNPPGENVLPLALVLCRESPSERAAGETGCDGVKSASAEVCRHCSL